MKGMLSAA